MRRVLPIAVISMSCSRAEVFHHPDGSSGGDDAPLAIDAAMIDAALIDAPTVDGGLPCKPPNIIHGDGKHNPGMDCMDSCHDHGFAIAGTLYLADGTTPANNATVTVVDHNNVSQDIIVGNNGNFWSFLPPAYPVVVTASMCPSTQVMVTHPTAGACNAVGCHEPGGVQGVAHL
jgi:hypothetical protein